MKPLFQKRTITALEFFPSIPKYIYYRFICAKSLGYLDPKLEEKIRLEISKINECRHCYHSHMIVAEYVNVDKGEIETLNVLSKIDKNSTDWLALNFARLYLYKLNKVPTMENYNDALVKLCTNLTDKQIEKIKTIVFVMNTNNRSMNTIEMFTSRLSRREKPAEESSAFSELMIIFFVSFIALPRILHLLIFKLRTKFRNRKSRKDK